MGDHRSLTAGPSIGNCDGGPINHCGLGQEAEVFALGGSSAAAIDSRSHELPASTVEGSESFQSRQGSRSVDVRIPVQSGRRDRDGERIGLVHHAGGLWCVAEEPAAPGNASPRRGPCRWRAHRIRKPRLSTAPFVSSACLSTVSRRAHPRPTTGTAITHPGPVISLPRRTGSHTIRPVG